MHIEKFPFTLIQSTRPPPKPIRISTNEIPESMDINPALYTDFEENSSFHDGVILETYQRPYKEEELEGLISTGRLVQKF